MLYICVYILFKSLLQTSKFALLVHMYERKSKCSVFYFTGPTNVQQRETHMHFKHK